MHENGKKAAKKMRGRPDKKTNNVIALISMPTFVERGRETFIGSYCIVGFSRVVVLVSIVVRVLVQMVTYSKTLAPL